MPREIRDFGFGDGVLKSVTRLFGAKYPAFTLGRLLKLKKGMRRNLVQRDVPRLAALPVPLGKDAMLKVYVSPLNLGHPAAPETGLQRNVQFWLSLRPMLTDDEPQHSLFGVRQKANPHIIFETAADKPGRLL